MLTPEQSASYAADGFLVIEGFASDGSCLELRRRALELIDGFDPASVDASVFSTTEQSHAQDEYFLTSGDKTRFFLEADAMGPDGTLRVEKRRAVNKIGHAMHDLDPVFERFSRTPELAELATDLGFVHPLLLQSMYILKEAGTGGEVIPHTDHTFLWTEPQTVTGFWFAVDDATVENGCLWALPGGHTIPVKGRFRRDGAGTTNDVYDDTPYPDEGFVPLEAERGTLVVLHGLLPHRSAPNRSDRPRHAYTIHLIDGSAAYPEDNWLRRSEDMPLRGFG